MPTLSRRQRLATVRDALRATAPLRERDTWTRAQLEAFQQERLADLLRHATARSAFYRERLGPAPSGLDGLPIVTKDELMERFDDWVTDPRLRRETVERHLAAVTGDELLDGEHRVMATGGSTGRRGIFVYSRAEWAELNGHFMYMLDRLGVKPSLPRKRFASIVAPGPTHMTWRLSASIDIGVHRRLSLAATDPIGDLVDGLNRFQPYLLAAYPSVAAELAEEQRRGRLRIAPALVTTSSELRTPEMLAAMRAAWEIEPHEVYGATDGLWGWTCEHRRLHLAEDMTIVEVVDADGRPVPDGATGERLVITNLFMRTQPVIRYEITDLVRLHADPCPCGRPTRSIAQLDGRSDDILRLPGAAGTVAVHPIHLRSPLTRLETVRQYQLVQEGATLRAHVVPRGAAETVAAEVRAALTGALRAAGADRTEVDVEIVDALAREPGSGGKLKLVRA